MRITSALVLLAATPALAARYLLVGSQTTTDPTGLTVFQTKSGVVTPVDRVTNTSTGNNPTYMALSHDKQFLYLTNEVKAGTLTAYRVFHHDHDDDDDHSQGELSLDRLGSASTNSTGPVHIILTNDNRFAIVASYDVGSVTIVSLLEDGRVGEIVDQQFFQGAALVVPDRQEGPHGHCVALTTDNRFVYITDLGNDKIMQYTFNDGKLTPNKVAPFVGTPPGSLPRHLAIHPNGRHVFLTTELTNTLVRYTIDQSKGTLRADATVKTTDKTGDQYAAAVHVTSNGRFVLVSNRGLNANENSIAVFDAKTLKKISVAPLRSGAYPRDFTISEDNIVYVGNQLTNDLVSFRLLKNGTLVPTAAPAVAIARPVVLLTL
ncbi:Aste57867_10270 [Aphanomyces stellatus]|uniref:Aste57867_10270 protein n=1 Tax=Aphanomyces stellatus TaxID=120398 RepID=A0A485KPW8_9STRA|nr:hypothetical protein As57867_010230 [Aphanomyces stellatus]VFT87145.1 Aste57867_10270 [Aphanomyces stellatus]